MTADLNALVSQYLSPQLVSQIASTAGLDPAAAQKLVSGAVPAVLASLAGALAAPGGAQKISDAVSNADPDTLAKLTAALGAGQLQALNDGAATLSGVIGADALSKLANALGQYVDAPPEAAQPAIGAVSQALIGIIGQQDPSTWSDAGAVAALIGGQKGAIAAALPSALSAVVGAAGAAAKAGVAAPPAAPGAPAAPSPVQGGAFPMWAIVVAVVVVLVVAAAAYWFLHHHKAKAPAAAEAPATIEFALRS